jgi:copper homeostasis protein
MLLEVCIDSFERLDAAVRHRAGRLEVCSRLDLDGLTPERPLLEAAVASRTPCVAMVRPRAGSHVWAGEEHAAVLADVATARELGAQGVVFGALTAARRVDRELTGRVVEAAGPLPVTFHRAFDATADLDEALETLVELGVRRILTSGGARDAHSGRERLRALVALAAGRIAILPGGGVRAHNATEILDATGVGELHTSSPFDPLR